MMMIAVIANSARDTASTCALIYMRRHYWCRYLFLTIHKTIGNDLYSAPSWSPFVGISHTVAVKSYPVLRPPWAELHPAWQFHGPGWKIWFLCATGIGCTWLGHSHRKVPFIRDCYGPVALPRQARSGLFRQVVRQARQASEFPVNC